MLLIKNGTVVSATDTIIADISVDNGKILSIQESNGDLSMDRGEDVIDATGKMILPGGVDAHTHFDLPMFGTVSSDDHYSGHKAAAFGGTTTVMDFVPLLPSVGSGRGKSMLEESIKVWSDKAAKAALDYSFHMNLTHYDDEIEKEIPILVEMGITSLKVFTAYNDRLRLDDGSIFRTLRTAKKCGMLVMAHCENGDVIEILIKEALADNKTAPIWHARSRPAWGAVEATLRMISLAAQAGSAIFIVHVNTSGEVDMLRYARENGVQAMGETCPQYLFFSEEKLLSQEGAKWVCSPPLRTSQDNDKLWAGLADGSLQTIGTDHCPFFFNGLQPISYEGKDIAIPGKELGARDFTKIPNGLPAVEDRLLILWSYGVGAGRLTANQFVALNCTNPAKIFGLYPTKGAILPGSDADLVIWDPLKKVRYGVAITHHRTDYNLYEGWELCGYPEKVFLRGQMIVDRGTWLGKAGMGQFIKRKPFAEVL
jgi:dihydropyrimidinase